MARAHGFLTPRKPTVTDRRRSKPSGSEMIEPFGHFGSLRLHDDEPLIGPLVLGEHTRDADEDLFATLDALGVEDRPGRIVEAAPRDGQIDRIGAARRQPRDPGRRIW